MDPVTIAGAAGTLDKIGARDGFLAVLVVVLLVGGGLIGWKLVGLFISALAKKDEECREERKEDREAHLGVMRALTDEVKELRRDLAPPARMRGG